MAATAKEIAEKAGVSLPTVWHVLGGKGERYRAETRGRVLAAAQALGYRPNGSARAISTGRFGCVALLLSTHYTRSAVYPQFLNGVYDALAEEDLHLTVARVPDEKLCSDEYVPKILRQHLADGLIIHYTHEFPNRLRSLIHEHEMPAVWTNVKQDTDSVYPDDHAAGRRSAEHLLSLGHQRIAYLAYSPSHHYSMADRRAGCEEAVREAGGELRVIGPQTPVKRARWEAMVSEALAAPDRPTALIAYGPQALRPAYVATLKRGLRVPEDLSLVVFDDHLHDDLGLPITSLVLPEQEMGRAAVAMLRVKIKAPAEAIPARPLPLTFAAGESCAPPSKA